MSDITSDDLMMAFYSYSFSRYEFMVPNVYIDWSGNEMDIFALRKSGYVDEIEIKISASDFNADFKKSVRVPGRTITPYPEIRPDYSWIEDVKIFKHDGLENGLCHSNRFSFLIPEHLVDKCDIPEHAGLYVYKEGGLGMRVEEVKAAPLLHKRKLSDDLKYKTARKMSFRYWDMKTKIRSKQ